MPATGVVLYDDACGFCRRSVAWLRRRDPDGRLRFVPLADEEGGRWLSWCGLDPGRRDTVVFVERSGRCSTHSGAVLRSLRGVRGPARLGVWLLAVPRPLRDAVYRWVSRNRSRLSSGRWFRRGPG